MGADERHTPVQWHGVRSSFGVYGSYATHFVVSIGGKGCTGTIRDSSSFHALCQPQRSKERAPVTSNSLDGESSRFSPKSVHEKSARLHQSTCVSGVGSAPHQEGGRVAGQLGSFGGPSLQPATPGATGFESGPCGSECIASHQGGSVSVLVPKLPASSSCELSECLLGGG